MDEKELNDIKGLLEEAEEVNDKLNLGSREFALNLMIYNAILDLRE